MAEADQRRLKQVSIVSSSKQKRVPIALCLSGFVGQSLCGAGFLACGRHSCRPWPPSPPALPARTANPHPAPPCNRLTFSVPPLSPCLSSPCFSVSSVPSVVCLLRVLRVLCGLPSPCSLWFAFSVPSPPPVTTFPKSFFLSFSTTSQLPLSSPLAPLLYVESERCG